MRVALCILPLVACSVERCDALIRNVVHSVLHVMLLPPSVHALWSWVNVFVCVSFLLIRPLKEHCTRSLLAHIHA